MSAAEENQNENHQEQIYYVSTYFGILPVDLASPPLYPNVNSQPLSGLIDIS